MNVVMVHGFGDTGRLFRRMSRTLEERGHACLAPTMSPADARLGIEDLSVKLASFVDGEVPAGAPMAMVGFSMGALVVRHYLQALGGARRTRAFFSIAGPHGGTMNAYLYPGRGTREMRPGSAFLRGLAEGAANLGGLPAFAYRTPFDLMVTPSTSCRMAGAEEVVVWCPFHSLMPGNTRVMGHIAATLAAIEASASGAGPAGAA